MERTFAAGFFEIGRSGRLWSRSDCQAAEAHPINIELPLPEFAVHAVTDDAVLVTYISRTVTDGVPLNSRRCSLWSHTREGWQLRFHLGTPIT
jgi:hypothetical protein